MLLLRIMQCILEYPFAHCMIIIKTINEQICDTAQFCLLHKEYQSIFSFAPRTNDISFCVNWKICSLMDGMNLS